MCGELKWAGRVVLTVVAMVLAVAGGACAKVIYVDDDAPANGDGSSWATAYTFLQDALTEAEATEETVEIRLARGTYRPDREAANPNGTGDRYASFRLTGSVALRGGFAGLGAEDPNARDVAIYRSILSGDLAGNDIELANPLAARGESSRAENCHHVLSCEEYHTKGVELSISLDGLVVTAGHAFRYASSGGTPTMATPAEHRGGGLYILGPREQALTLIIMDCLFEGNYAEETGGALYSNYSTSLLLRRCVLRDNGTKKSAGAVYVTASNVQLDGCRLERNHAGNQGGGVTGKGYSMVLRACTLSRNAAFGG